MKIAYQSPRFLNSQTLFNEMQHIILSLLLVIAAGFFSSPGGNTALAQPVSAQSFPTQTVSAQTIEPFDHRNWNHLLQRHVHWILDGHASAVDYVGMQREREKVQHYLTALSAVSRAAFDSWPTHTQLAFLINAYNAFTVQLILTRYPDLESIKDLGSFFQSPWKQSFIPLLGATRTLDEIEHELIRGSGRYRDPRIHFAVNCASIGCPALRPEAYTGETLEPFLEDQAIRFLGDRGRNNLKGTTIRLSPIFKWYREDFEQGFRGAATLAEFLLHYAKPLGLSPAQGAALQSGSIAIEFGDYDWSLNDHR